LLNVPQQELEAFDKKLADLIIKNREGKLIIKPGYDGEYGVALIEGKKEKQRKLLWYLTFDYGGLILQRSKNEY